LLLFFSLSPFQLQYSPEDFPTKETEKNMIKGKQVHPIFGPQKIK
jgi:hypothetical protein